MPSPTAEKSNTKIKRAVPAFCATTRFDQGVREAVDFLYANPQYQRLDPAFDNWCDQVIERYESMTSQLPKLDG